MMQPLSTDSGSELRWVQPGTLERAYELRGGDTLFGQLRFDTAFGTRAAAGSASGHWTFKRVGFLNPRVTIRQEGQEENIAVYWPKLRGDGWVEFPAGRQYHWKALNIWGTRWGFADQQEQLVFLMRPGVEKPKMSDLLKTQAVVEIPAHRTPDKDMPLLLLLGWYLMILHEDDEAATVATTVAAIS